MNNTPISSSHKQAKQTKNPITLRQTIERQKQHQKPPFITTEQKTHVSSLILSTSSKKTLVGGTSYFGTQKEKNLSLTIRI